MAELSLDEKCRAAAELIKQSPPGQVNDVINDLRAIINDDEKLMEFVRPALREYNLSQLTTVEHQAEGDIPAHSSLLSEATVLPGTEGLEERYVDVNGKRSFKFDHITLATSEYEPYEIPSEEEEFRAELAKSLAAYTKNHFPSGVSAVSSSQLPLLPTPAPQPVAESSSVEDTAEKVVNEEKEEKPEEPVTDVIEEQVAAGDNEPAPTPQVGEAPLEEVVSPGGIEKVDEKVEEVKEAEGAEEGAKADEPVETAESSEPIVASETPETDQETKIAEPEVVEVGGNVEESKSEEEQVAAVPAPAAEKEQQRVENPIYTLEVVGNRYNTSNFWTGRWRTRWVVDRGADIVCGTILVDVHYYEQGNVQLATKHTASFPCPVQANGSQSVASQIVTSISKVETNYQLELNDVYDQLGDKAFRALRRALPVTRQKMDWDKVGGYSLGSDLTKSRN